MYLLFCLLPFWGLEILAPVMLWILAPRWHRVLFCVYTAVALVVLFFWVRDVRRERAEHRLIAATHATWRWSRHATPESYRVRLTMFLALRGWRVDASVVTPRGRVELLARKDRCSVLLLCVGPRQAPADGLDLQHAAAAQAQTRATHAAIISRAPAAAALGMLSPVQQLRFSDLTSLEQKAAPP